MARKGSGKRQLLRRDKNMRRWYENLARGSLATADNYLRILGLFLEENKLTPNGFVAMSAKAREDCLADHIEMMMKRGKAGSYASVVKKTIVSWLEWNGKKLHRKIKIPGASRTPTLDGAHIPSQDELRNVLNVADARARTTIVLIAFSGLREGVLGSYRGDDGLRLRDLPELKIKRKGLHFECIPTKVLVPERLSKNGRPYFTFLGSEGCEYLMAYLHERTNRGEKLTSDSPVITPKNVDKPFMRALNIGDIIRKVMRAVGLKEPPYIWRSYFASRSMLAESKGLLRDYRQFFMGHKGDIEHVYTLHKTVPPDTVEAMRKAYEAALEYLETIPRVGSKEEELKRMFRAELLKMAGFTDKEIEKGSLHDMPEEKVREIIRDRLVGKKANNNNCHQKVVGIDQIENYVGEGWEFIATLPNNKVILRHPS